MPENSQTDAPGLKARADERLQSKGREENAAQPLDAAKDNGGPERYPSVRKDDAIEVRTFNPVPPQGAGDSSANPSESDKAGGKR